MRQGKDGRSSRHIRWSLHREILVEPTRGVWSGRPGTGIKDAAKLVSRLWADSVDAVVDREGNADLDARFNRFLYQ